MNLVSFREPEAIDLKKLPCRVDCFTSSQNMFICSASLQGRRFFYLRGNCCTSSTGKLPGLSQGKVLLVVLQLCTKNSLLYSPSLMGLSLAAGRFK